GDVTAQSIVEVLEGEEMAKMRRWGYGVDEAPDDFICRTCAFALRRWKYSSKRKAVFAAWNCSTTCCARRALRSRSGASPSSRTSASPIALASSSGVKRA